MHLSSVHYQDPTNNWLQHWMASVYNGCGLSSPPLLSPLCLHFPFLSSQLSFDFYSQWCLVTHGKSVCWIILQSGRPKVLKLWWEPGLVCPFQVVGCWSPLRQWLSTFLRSSSFNSVPCAAVTPPAIRLFLLLPHNYNFLLLQIVNVYYARYLAFDSWL